MDTAVDDVVGDDSVSSSAMDDGLSSLYGGGTSMRGGGKSAKKGDASEFGMDSASVSGFRQD